MENKRGNLHVKSGAGGGTMVFDEAHNILYEIADIEQLNNHTQAYNYNYMYNYKWCRMYERQKASTPT